MNTFKKIGLTALGTTLVASSAIGGELSVSGDAGYTWSSESVGVVSTDGVGYNHDVSFSGSGELDNGWSVSTGMTIVEDSSLSSSNVKLTMGSLGSIQVGNGTGGTGASFDSVTPTAYEENHDGMKTTTAIDSMGAGLGNGGIDYYSPALDIMGASVDFMLNYTPEASGTAVGEGGVSTAHATLASGQAAGVNIGYGAAKVGAYVAEISTDAGTEGTYDSDRLDATWYAKYTAGPVSIGYQFAYLDTGHTGAAAANNSSAKVIGTANGAFESETMSIAFNVNDSLSFSWSELTETYDEQDMGTVADVDMDSTSIQFAYTMGSMSIKGYQTDVDNPGWDSDAKSDEVTEIAVNFAF